MVEPKPLVPVIVGPTAVGKTAVAEALARYRQIVVISADSRQVYRGLDIGTAKPDPELRARVPHLGIDLVEPGERYSAGRFARDAASWLAASGSGPRPVVVGGTGLYIRALAEGLFREPRIDADRRERLGRWAAAIQGLGRWAARLDPEYTGGGRQRAARAVEVALLTGRPLSWWRRAAREEGVMRPHYFRLSMPRAVLHQRIAARIDAMLAAGWVEETRRVLSQGASPDAPGLDAVGYREIIQHLRSRLTSQELREAIIIATRRYAKRQETWFRHQLPGSAVETLDATAPADRLARRITEFWEQISD